MFTRYASEIASRFSAATNGMKLKRRGLYLLFFAVVLIIVAKMYLEGFVRMLRMDKMSYSSITARSYQGPTSTQFKTILLWTPFFSIKDYIAPLESLGCVEARCNVTSDRSKISWSDAILFHHRDLNPHDVPKERYPWQRWVYLNHESPPNSPQGSISGLEDKFNWTITYRLDSDILLTPLPRIRKSPVTSWEKKDFSQNKTRMAVWFVSNCRTPGNREAYVVQLGKTIPVDIYGDCGTKKCAPKMSPKCYKDVAKEYRFYLSFENSICTDYVTEKLYHIYDFDIAPITFGGADYEKVAPPGSFINAMHFSSPRALGRHLLDLAKTPKKYNKFFEWKRNYENTVMPYACQLCEKLHNTSEPSKVWTNLKKWWYDEGNCRRWSFT